MTVAECQTPRRPPGERARLAAHWAGNWLRIGALAARRGPRMPGELRRFPWMLQILKANQLMDMMVRTRSGPYAEANAVAVSAITAGILDQVRDMLSKPGQTVLHEDLVPPELLHGMGLNPWMAEFLGIVLPLIETRTMEHYIDVAENHGIPADICSLPKSTMGLVLKNEMPAPAAVVTSNMPCDGGMSQYTLIQQRMGVPVFRLDVPFHFYSERAVDYFVNELKQLIAWLEEHTPGRMDWDRMREVCEARNRYVALEYDLWDLLRTRPAPMAAEPVYLSHLMYGIAQPASNRGARAMQRVVDIARSLHAQGRGAVPDERFRTVLWNPPTLIFPDLFTWAEQAYGVAMIMDMLTFHRHPFIDTSTPETMLRGLAQVIMQGPMARHTRGPAENFFSDLFYLYEHFDLDMIWMAGHIGCKNTQALNGMFREKCRERGIPLLIIDYDLSDTRIVPPEGIRGQVEQFMETVMKA